MTLEAGDLETLDMTAGGPGSSSAHHGHSARCADGESQFHSAGEIASSAVEETHADK
jgi:hypothetical protein